MTDLKLIALDNEDLGVISAHVQDAIVRVGDMGYARADKRFALLMNRFDWEAQAPRQNGIRKRAGLHFERVRAVRHAGFDIDAQDGVLELLAITFTPEEEPGGTIELAFAGGGTVRLEVECIEGRLADTGAAWAARRAPRHVLD